MPTICAEFGIRTSATRGVSARGACDERDAACCRVAKTRRCRPFARRRRASRANKDFAREERARRRRKRETVVDALVSRETRLSCTVCEKASLDVAFAAVGRAGPHVAPSRGAGRAARPRASRRAIGSVARRRVGNLARGSSRRRPRLAAPIEGGASSSRVSCSRRRTRRAFEREGGDAETRRPCEPNTRAMDDAPRSAWSRPARAAPPSPAGP